MNWPDASVDRVQSREGLARFLCALAASVEGGQRAAENLTVGALIGAAGRWTGSMDGFFQNIMNEPVSESPDWSMIAAIFSAALVYE